MIFPRRGIGFAPIMKRQGLDLIEGIARRLNAVVATGRGR
jgi:hypothetical protein